MSSKNWSMNDLSNPAIKYKKKEERSRVCLILLMLFNSAHHLDLVEQILISSVRILLEKLHHDLTHVDLLLHQSEDGAVLLTRLHEDVVGEGCRVKALMSGRVHLKSEQRVKKEKNPIPVVKPIRAFSPPSKPVIHQALMGPSFFAGTPPG